MTNGDPYSERKRLTFAQAEGIEPLPTQLALGEISTQLRVRLWKVVHDSMMRCRVHAQYGRRAHLIEPWQEVLKRKHVMLEHAMIDEFESDASTQTGIMKATFEDGPYHEVFDLVQWLLRQQDCPINPRLVQSTLVNCRAAYRLLDDQRTIVPISSTDDAKVINQALADLARAEFNGARAHLQAAAQHLTTGTAADSIRESMQAVESVARVLGDSKTLSGALQKLKSKKTLHPALEQGFKNIYGFTSDEQGIRHPLLDDGTANVDEYDAMFMIGACSAFVSYLINRSR